MEKYIIFLLIVAAVASSGHAGYLGHPVGYSSGFAAPSHHFAAPPPVHFAASPQAHFAAPAPTHFATPLPVAPISVNTYATTSHHTFASASPTPVVKYHAGFNPIRSYSAGPSFTKIGFASQHIPSVYSGPLPYDFPSPTAGFNGWDTVKFSSPAESYGGWDAPAAVVNYAAPVAAFSGWDAPKTVVKFGRPITTTTTTYSTGALGAVRPPQAYAAAFRGPVGW